MQPKTWTLFPAWGVCFFGSMRMSFVTWVLGASPVLCACAVTIEPTNQHAAGGARDAGTTMVGAGVTSGTAGDVGSGGATGVGGATNSGGTTGTGGGSGA